MDYIQGDTVRVSTAIKDQDTLASTDPGSVVFKFLNGRTREETSYVYGVDSNVVRDSLGHFHCDVLVPDAGQWSWRIELSGGIAGVEEGVFFVNPTNF